ncbi:MAG TPA: hypothetical protein VK585_04130 [Jiangellaceae bacterium]|nr:hypothetical protein [Jiangellaceae bacterium]
MNPLLAGALAAVPGAGVVVLAGAHVPGDARLWIWIAACGVLLAVHPALRWASSVALVGALVAVVLRAGVSGLPLGAAAGLGVLMLVYVLALDLAELVERIDGSTARLTLGWAEALSVPAAAGLGAGALALVVAAVPVSPSLPLALAAPVAVVSLAVIALRSRPAR